MSWFVLGTQKGMFSLPNWEIAYSWSSLIVIVLVILICTTSAYFASRKAIKGLPAVFLRGKDKEVKHIFLEKIGSLWSKISYEGKWAIRDAFINRVRVLMGVIGVAGSMMLLIAGVGMPISTNHLVDKAYNEDFSYSRRLTVSDYDLANETYDGQWVQISQAHFSKDDGYNRLLIVVSDGDFVNATTEDGQKIQAGGLYVTNGFAKAANIKEGDELTVTPYQDGKEYAFKVKGIVTSETNQGAYILSSSFEKAGGTFKPQTLLVGNDIPLSEISTINSLLCNCAFILIMPCSFTYPCIIQFVTASDIAVFISASSSNVGSNCETNAATVILANASFTALLTNSNFISFFIISSSTLNFCYWYQL